MKNIFDFIIIILLILFISTECYAPNLYENEDEYFENKLIEYEKAKANIKKIKLLSIIDNNLIIYTKKMADLYKIDFYLILAVMKAESGGAKNAVSKCGAIGLMQIMPILGIDYGYTEDELFNPYINIKIGVMQLSYLINKYKSVRIALMCYLCGETFVYKNFNRACVISKDYINKINNYLGGNYI